MFALERGALAPDTLGLHLDEAKDLLAAVQETMVAEQARAALAAKAAPARPAGRPTVTRTPATSWCGPCSARCACPAPAGGTAPARRMSTATFSPLAELLPERTTPELLYLEAKFAGLVSYGTSARLLAEVLPLGRPLHATAVRLHAQAVAQRLEDELGDRSSRASSTAARPTGRSCPARTCRSSSAWTAATSTPASNGPARDGWFEVIAGKAIPARRAAKCFGYVQTYDTKPKRRLFEVLRRPGHAGQPAGHLPHRRRRRRPRPAAVPQPRVRAPARLVPRHHAAHRA